MPGLLDLANISKDQALQGFGQAAKQEQNRNQQNEMMQQQAKAQRKQAIGSAIGTGVTTAMMVGGPAGMAVGGLMLLGSLF